MMQLTPRQNLHLIRIRDSFNKAVTIKFRKGAEEHGGDLQDMDSLQLVRNAMDECIDQWTYLKTLEEKLIMERSKV
jgi:hypothetical protein